MYTTRIRMNRNWFFEFTIWTPSIDNGNIDSNIFKTAKLTVLHYRTHIFSLCVYLVRGRERERERGNNCVNTIHSAIFIIINFSIVCWKLLMFKKRKKEKLLSKKKLVHGEHNIIIYTTKNQCFFFTCSSWSTKRSSSINNNYNNCNNNKNKVLYPLFV